MRKIKQTIKKILTKEKKRKKTENKEEKGRE